MGAVETPSDRTSEDRMEVTLTGIWQISQLALPMKWEKQLQQLVLCQASSFWRYKPQTFAKQSSAFAHIAKEEQYDDQLEEELNKKEEEHSGCQKFRAKGKHALHSRVVLAIVVCLCVLDCILVIGELILDMYAIKEAASDFQGINHHNGAAENSSFVKQGPVSDHETSGSAHNNSRHRRASGSGEHSGGSEHGHSIQEDIAHAFHYASIAILAILVVETLFKIFFEGKEFLKKKIEMFDAFVVMVSFIVDLVFLKGITTLPIQESAYILSFILPWRVIRVVNSLVVAVLDHEHFKLLLVYKSKKYLKKQMDEMRDDMHVLRKQLHAVKALCMEAGTEEWVVNKTIVNVSSQFAKKEKCALSSFANFTAGAMISEKKGGIRKAANIKTSPKPEAPSVDEETKKVLGFTAAIGSYGDKSHGADWPNENGEVTKPRNGQNNERPLLTRTEDSDVRFADED